MYIQRLYDRASKLDPSFFSFTVGKSPKKQCDTDSKNVTFEVKFSGLSAINEKWSDWIGWFDGWMVLHGCCRSHVNSISESNAKSWKSMSKSKSKELFLNFYLVCISILIFY